MPVMKKSVLDAIQLCWGINLALTQILVFEEGFPGDARGLRGKTDGVDLIARRGLESDDEQHPGCGGERHGGNLR